MKFSGQERQTAFSIWMRTGRWPRTAATQSVEVKFNPWHDPRNGQFTFAGAGRYVGPGSAQSANSNDQDVPPYAADPNLPGIHSREELHAWAAAERAKFSNDPKRDAHFRRIAQYVRESETEFAEKPIEEKPIDKPGSESIPQKPNRDGTEKSGDFIGGLGEGLLDAGKGAATGLYTLVTTDPRTTIVNIGRGIAGTIDTVLAAEDTPGYVHFNRAANAISRASAHDIGYALGQTVANVGMAVAPGAIAVKVSAVSRVGEVGKFVAAQGNFSKVWKMNPIVRGDMIEHVFGHNLPKNFPVIDKIKSGSVSSIKSIDLDSSHYINSKNLRKTLTRHIDKISSYRGTSLKGWAGIIVKEEQIKTRVLDLVIPHGGLGSQSKILRDSIKYASGLNPPVKVRVTRFNEANP